MADLLNVVTPISTIRGKCFKRLERAGPNQKVSNWFAYFQRQNATIKSVDRILGIVSIPDILFCGFLFHPIVYCIY